jgi:dTDP-4-dehydrorhamnose 3,5-epimerase
MDGAVPTPDRQTVTPEGRRIDPLPAGVTLRDAVTHVDERGSVCEMFDPRWGWHPDPLVFVYTFTIRPGWAKGWGVHRRHEDRYFLMAGELEVVFYDERDDSPTSGLVAKIVLSDHRRCLMNIPAGVWHTDRNLGDTDCVVVNFPTIVYDHAAPDKERLPLHTDAIPYEFAPDVKGW